MAIFLLKIKEDYLIQELKKRIDFEVNSIQFIKRDGHIYLDIELPDKDLKSIESKTKLILSLIEEIDHTNEDYFLNIFSSGTEKEIDIKNIGLFIGENLLVKTKKPYLEKQEWEGPLEENEHLLIVLKVNNKGRFQKIKIKKEDISFIKTTAKLKKEKK